VTMAPRPRALHLESRTTMSARMLVPPITAMCLSCVADSGPYVAMTMEQHSSCKDP
jgi:hypothetical protein